MKIGAIIPIRLNSQRLPRKALMKIQNKPVLYLLLDRICSSKFLKKENVVICMTNKCYDDELENYVNEYGAGVYRGHPDDLIKRIYDCMNYYQFDIAAQIDGDDILADPEYMDLCISKLIEDSSIDVVTSKGLPLGISTKAFTNNAVNKVFSKYKTEQNDTGFGSYFTETDICVNHQIEPISESHIFDKVRLTLDYIEDFNLFKRIFNELYVEGKTIRLDQIVELLKSNPEITEINYFLQEEYMKRWTNKRNISYEANDGKIITI